MTDVPPQYREWVLSKQNVRTDSARRGVGDEQKASKDTYLSRLILGIQRTKA